MKTVSGCFGANQYAMIQKSLLGRIKGVVVSKGIIGTAIKAKDIISIEQITDANKVSLLGAVGGGAVGALLAGPIGLAAGAILGGRKQSVAFTVTFRKGRRTKSFVAVGSMAEYLTLYGLVHG